MSKIVFIAGTKGGSGKTATAHLASLGAYLRGQPAAYVLTDPERNVRGNGRPYGVLDGRLPLQLASILENSRNALNGWVFIDGGGNRPAFDVELSRETNLCVLPFRASEEDVDTVVNDLVRLPKALAWPTAWPTNAHAERAASFLIEGLAKAFPGRVISTPIPFVNSVSDLLVSNLGSPSTPTRSLARKVFDLISDTYEEHARAEEGAGEPRAGSPIAAVG